MHLDISPEIIFRSARSSGKGGQNVNKVETMVEGRWKIEDSDLLTEKQKEQITRRLASRITKEGFLLIKSQAERTQLGNKAIVVRKMNELVNEALIMKTARIATRPTMHSGIKRLENKKRKSEIKQNRKKWNEE